MAVGMFLFAAVDTQAKFLTDSLHTIQIVWFRQLGLLLGILPLLCWRGMSVLQTSRPVLQIGRGACAAGSSALFIFAVAHVPLADAVAVTFVAPFLVTIMAALILRESVGIRRWTAVIIGFFGTLIVIRPGMGVIHPAAFLLVLAAALFAVRQIIGRTIGGTDRTGTTVAYTALVSTFLVTLPLPFVWKWPTLGPELAILCCMALMAGAAEFCVIKSLELAQAVAVAPLHYTLLIWGTIWGYLVFADLPDAWTWSGALIIIATGFYTLRRERLAARQN